MITPKTTGQVSSRYYRKARWTDAEPAVQQLLDILPMLPPIEQQRVWQAWQSVWQTVTHPLPYVDTPLPLPQQALAARPKRRRLDSVPFAAELLQQLPLVSPAYRAHWVKRLNGAAWSLLPARALAEATA